MLRIDGIDGLTPEYKIIEDAKNYLEDIGDWCEREDGKLYSEKIIRRNENKLVGSIIDTISTQSGDVEAILTEDNGVVLISAIYDFVSAKYAIRTIYQKYELANMDYIYRIGYAMSRVIELLADVTIGGGCRSASRHMKLITIRAALGSIEAYAGFLFQVDTTKFSIQDKVLCTTTAGSLSGGLRTIAGFTYVMGGRR